MHRRQFLATVPALGLAGKTRAAPSAAEPLLVAGYAYDRVQAILNGSVGVPGKEVRFETSDIYALSQSAFGPEQRYDVTEIGLIPFMRQYINNGFRDYILLPVFISRTFRHRNIYVRTDAGIDAPEDLRGKRVGTPGYGYSAHTWIRGMLADEYGVQPRDMQWIETTESSDGALGTSDLNRHFLPGDFPLTKGPTGVDESELLVAGGCDALVTAIAPKAFLQGDPRVRQLFPNVKAAEHAYFQKTRVFPIMHAVAVRREIANANPDLMVDLFTMYSAAKQKTYAELDDTTALRVTLPWAVEEFQSTRALMGENYWSYGINANRKALNLAMRYVQEQGLTKTAIDPLEFFHPSTHGLSE